MRTSRMARKENRRLRDRERPPQNGDGQPCCYGGDPRKFLKGVFIGAKNKRFFKRENSSPENSSAHVYDTKKPKRTEKAWSAPTLGFKCVP